MNRPCFKLAIATWVLSASAAAVAQQCKGLTDLEAKTSSSGSLHTALQWIGLEKEQVECSSLSSVFYALINDHKAGGRKLEEDRPFNAQAAQTNLANAQADPEVRQRLEKMRKEVTDATRRLVYEAAIFDEEGYYLARDLRINQLKQQLK